MGRLDIVRGFFDDAGGLKPPATEAQLIDGFAWACEFGRISVIEFMLEHGVNVDTKLKGGEIGLHWAAYEGHVDAVRLLLARGARVDLADDTHGGTPLGWALYGWGNTRPREREHRSYYETAALLVRAGATVDEHWFDGNIERERGAAKMRSDIRMMEALRGAVPGDG